MRAHISNYDCLQNISWTADHCSFNLKDSKSISSNDTPLNDDASLCKVLFQAFQKISPRHIITEISNLCCDLDPDHSNPVFHPTRWLMLMNRQARFSSSEDIAETDMLLYSPHCGLDLCGSKPSFTLTLGLLVVLPHPSLVTKAWMLTRCHLENNSDVEALLYTAIQSFL